MKHSLTTLAVVLAPLVALTTAGGQQPVNRELPSVKPIVVRAVAAGSSGPVSSIAGEFADLPPRGKETAVEVFGGPAGTGPLAGDRHDTDAAPARMFEPRMPDPSRSFDGLSNFDNLAGYGLFIMPPDPIGDIGPSHYVQAVNALVRIFDRSGVPVTPPFKMSAIFGPLGTVCANRNDGDPMVQYDPLADRWLLSQFCTAFPPFRQMIAISKTGDPTGDYHIYEFVMPNIRLNDYPKFGVWHDGYYMSTDEFLGSEHAGSGAFAFDRAKMLVGDSEAKYIYFSLPALSSTVRVGGLLPADLDGLNPPPAGAPNVFAGYSANEYGEPLDGVRLYDFHADFATPANSSLTERPESPVAVAEFDPTSPTGRMDITQPPPGEMLDSQSDRLMYRASYRNFGTHDSLVLNQTVRVTPFLEPYRAGVRVYELRRSGAGFFVHEQATIGEPSSSRWIGNAALDHEGNLAVAYNHVSQLKPPSILYSGRLATDPAGYFRNENNLVVGTGVQKAFGFRWGDYSGMNVDPVDDCTFWLTNQYYTLESQEFSDYTWLTRIGSFKFPECTAAPRGMIRGRVTNSVSGGPVSGATITASAYTRNSGPDGNFGDLTVVPGPYQVTAQAKGFVSKTAPITVAGGEVVMNDFALEPVAIVESVGIEIVSESCVLNRAAESGESVTVNVAFRNSGALPTGNLNVTLRRTGGVTRPGPAQDYGILPADGTAVSRPFTFTVSPGAACGGEIMMEFRLRSGSENLPSVTIPLRVGAPRTALSEDFDRMFGKLPPRWTTSATGAQGRWTIRDNRRTSGGYSIFSAAPRQVGVNELVSPVLGVSTAGAYLSFSVWYDLESTFLRTTLYDGAVLELKMGEGDWQDIIEAGGAFETGGYDGVLTSCCQNPLAGRMAWSGRSGINQTPEFVPVKVRLPSAASGRNIQLRWRVATDIGTFREGIYIDDVTLFDGYSCNCPN